MTTAISGATATSVDDIPFNPHKRDYKKAGIIVAFCIIPVALLVVFTYWPFIQMCGYSFYKMKYIGTPRFIGFKNYTDIFTRPELLATLKLSLYYMPARSSRWPSRCIWRPCWRSTSAAARSSRAPCSSRT